MKLYDLDKLIRDTKQDNLYNFFDPTFKMNIGINLQQHVVAPEEEMRIDLVCNNIYNSIEQVDFLLDLNDIDNPLNIMEGDQILYASVTAIPEYRVKTIDNNNARAKLLNANKSSRKDDNRKKYLDESYVLPPTFVETPEAPVKISNNQIVIG
jgi:hypothetical protein